MKNIFEFSFWHVKIAFFVSPVFNRFFHFFNDWILCRISHKALTEFMEMKELYHYGLLNTNIEITWRFRIGTISINSLTEITTLGKFRFVYYFILSD